MSLLTGLHWWWDLAASAATITDQHNGLSLTRAGTVTTDASGGPGGKGSCDFNAGWFLNASVARPFNYKLGSSFNCWFHSASTAGNQWIINHRSNSVGGVYWQSFVSSSNASANIFDSAINAATVGPIAVPSLNTWHMLTITDNGTIATGYMNGVSFGTASTAALGPFGTANAPFAIGVAAWNTGFGRYIGKLAMAGVWSVPLTAANITSLYNGGAGVNYAGLASASVSSARRRRTAQQSIQGVF